MKIRRFAMPIMACALLSFMVACDNNGKNTANEETQAIEQPVFVPVTNVMDYVVDAGTYTELDYDYANTFVDGKYDGWTKACTAVAKTLPNGQTVVGRNMDLYISNKPAYILRTKCEGFYETVGLSYTNVTGPDYQDVLENGLPEEIHKVLPFLITDVMNSKGLYIETNMRNGEYWATGENKYGCSGTNPEAETRICSALLPRYIGERCATVDEALEYVKTLDIYTINTPELIWNFCFLMADSTGHYGILEIAQNEISWLDGQQAQANFYLTEKFHYNNELACGIGRYETVMNGVGAVETESDMYDLIRKVCYSKVYHPDEAGFDVRTEFVALKDYWTYEVVTNDEFKELVMEKIRENVASIEGKTRQEIQDMNSVWESIFTEVANCNERTLTVRFFEDESRVLTLSFEE